MPTKTVSFQLLCFVKGQRSKLKSLADLPCAFADNSTKRVTEKAALLQNFTIPEKAEELSAQIHFLARPLLTRPDLSQAQASPGRVSL